MQKEIIREIRELKQLLEKVIGLDKETQDKKYSEESISNAQKLYLKMSIDRGDWVKESEIGRYIKSLPWNAGSFIRKEFEFTDWIKRGHEYLYSKKELISLGEELEARKIDCKLYDEFLRDKAAYDKRMLAIEDARNKKIPPGKYRKG